MSLNIHPSAASNFDTKAAAFVDLIKEIPAASASQPSFPSERHVAASLTDKDIIGEIKIATTDYRGRIIARFFQTNEKQYGLEEESYLKVIELAEALQGLPTIRSKLSTSFIETTLFTWIKKKFDKEDVVTSFTNFLDQQATASIETITLWTPVANLEIEVPFPLSRSELRPLSKKMIDQWEQKVITLSSVNRDAVTVLFDDLRKKYQGLAAVVTTVNAEPERAHEFAMEEAERITSVLGIFSEAVLIPDIKCVSKIKGMESIAQATTIMEFEGDLIRVSSEIIDKSSARTWRLTHEEITHIRELLLDSISRLLAAESLNAFEKAVLNSILLYSKSAFTSAPVEKLVYILSSLESILLKNETEPIQQNLAERLAVFTAQGLDKRKQIIKTVKSVYGLRSRYLHHGHTHAELELMSEFMLCVWHFFMQMMANIGRFSTKDNFVCAIDDHKLT